MTAQELFDSNLDWAAALARNVHRNLPPSFDLADLVQVAHIELWKRAQSYNEIEHAKVPFQGYAYQPIRGAVLMSCRRRHYREATHEEITPAMFSRGPEGEKRILAEIASHEEDERYEQRRCEVLKLITTLPAIEAYLVGRVYLDGMDVEDVALTWQVPKTQIAGRLARALRRLKQAAQV